MRKVLKVLGVLLGVVVLAVVVGVLYVEASWDKDYRATPMPALQASPDPAVIAQGEYVVHALAHCQACHTSDAAGRAHEPHPDKTDFSAGFMQENGPFGTFRPANLTPDAETGIGALPDGVVARAIRSGVDRDGHLAIVMATSVGPMADEDLVAVLSYLRSLPAKKNATGKDEWAFMSKMFASQMKPHDEEAPPYVPQGEASVERGRYIANGPGACYGCHTPFDLSTFGPGPDRFSGEAMAEPDPLDGGFEFVVPNLTPDPETGIITSWSEDQFVARFQQGRLIKTSKMPWDQFKNVTENDVRSIYRYLRTLPPKKHVTGPSRRPAGSFHEG